MLISETMAMVFDGEVGSRVLTGGIKETQKFKGDATAGI